MQLLEFWVALIAFPLLSRATLIIALLRALNVHKLWVFSNFPSQFILRRFLRTELEVLDFPVKGDFKGFAKTLFDKGGLSEESVKVINFQLFIALLCIDIQWELLLM